VNRELFAEGHIHVVNRVCAKAGKTAWRIAGILVARVRKAIWIQRGCRIRIDIGDTQLLIEVVQRIARRLVPLSFFYFLFVPLSIAFTRSLDPFGFARMSGDSPQGHKFRGQRGNITVRDRGWS
jgi:hypothetical protein